VPCLRRRTVLEHTHADAAAQQLARERNPCRAGADDTHVRFEHGFRGQCATVDDHRDDRTDPKIWIPVAGRADARGAILIIGYRHTAWRVVRWSAATTRTLGLVAELQPEVGDLRTNAMKLIVTGASGMLGSAVCPTLRQEGHEVRATDIRLLGPDVERLDVRDLAAVETYCRGFAPDGIMHLAAETSLEVCEHDIAHAYNTNTLGTRNVAWACRERDIPLVYISSIGVFDGTKIEPYDERDVPNPINVYGRTKWGGELVVESVLERHFIVRAGWMIGGGEREKKFVALIIQQLREGAEEIFVVTDKLGTPTYSLDFSRGLSWLIASPHYGTYHLSSGGNVSRFEVARKILDVLGRTDVKLTEITSDSEFIRDRFPTVRPRSEAMVSVKTAALGIDSMRSWDVALEEYLRTAYAGDIRPAAVST
jgi:dTDP-4-dehydrorhamnose reductase